MDVTPIAWGFGLVEGPRTDVDNNLYFSDATEGGVYRRTNSGDIQLVVPDRLAVGGLALHRDGGFIMTGPTVEYWNDGASHTLLELDGVKSFNDCHTDADGRLYVGTIRSDVQDLKAPREMGECWRIDLDGTAEQVYGDVELSNGIGFSPEGRTMYHCDSTAKGLIAHDVDAAGDLGNRRLIAQPSFERGLPDGMCVDVDGNLWVAHVGGRRVVKLDPLGNELDEIAVPAKWVTSVAFGGPEMSDMYIVTADNLSDESMRGTIFSTSPGVAGLPTPLAAMSF